MDNSKITTEEIKGMPKAKLKELEAELRKEIANLKMSGYMAAAVNTGRVSKLKKNLARVLTFAKTVAS
jgi:ribosomal protein L29